MNEMHQSALKNDNITPTTIKAGSSICICLDCKRPTPPE